MVLMRLLVLISVVGWVICVRHNHHQQLNYSQEEYLSSLNDLDKRVRGDWQQVRKLIDSARNQLNRTGISNADRVSILEESMAEQRDVLGRIEAYIGLPFGLKPCTKTFNLSDYDRKEIGLQLQHIRESIRRLQTDIDLCGTDCTKFMQLRKEISLEEQYLSSIETLVSAQCRYARQFREDSAIGMIDINRSIPVANLAATNWIYGNVTSNEYKYMMFALASKFNISKCKIDKPFAVNRESCVKCPKERPLFNLGKGECVPCPSGHYFSRKRLNCTKGIDNEPKQVLYNSNQRALNFIGKRPLFNESLETCDTDAPFSTGDECIICRAPLVFSFNTLTCVRCPKQTTYSMNLRKCVRPTRSMFSSLEEAENWITTNRRPIDLINEWKAKHKRNSERTCASATPYFDNVSCIACELPKVFNMDTLLCVEPTKPYIFDQNIHLVVRKASVEYNTRPDSPNLLIEQGVKPPTNNSNLCPIGEPYFDGITCVQCQEPKTIFNYKSKLCTMCSQGKLFDPSVKRCELVRTKYYTNLRAQNILFGQGKSLEQYEAEQNSQRKQTPFTTQLCPTATPFMIKGNCQNCPTAESLFSLETNSCTSCGAHERYLNELHSCRGIKYSTNVDAPNLLVRNASTYKRLVDSFEASKTAKLEDRLAGCPNEQPYFNGKECIGCSQPTPLFSLDDQLCSKCSTGKIYSVESRTCVEVSYATSPNALNLVVTDIARYRQQFQDKRSKSEKFEECPTATPYYSNGACIGCPPERRLFDLDKGQCVKCRQGLNYHPDKLKCLAEKVSISSSLEKMLMNIG